MSVIQAAPIPSIHRLTADEFEDMPDSKGLELVDGLIVEKNVGTESSWIAGTIFACIYQFVRETKSGWAFPRETAFKCFADDAMRVRKPDAAYIRSGRLPNEQPPRGFCTIAPDLAVEVVSPRDIASDLEQKVLEYLAAGVKLVWVIYPLTRNARVDRLDGSVAAISATDSLDGENVLPGFKVKLDTLFPPIEPVVAVGS